VMLRPALRLFGGGVSPDADGALCDMYLGLHTNRNVGRQDGVLVPKGLAQLSV
jgi:hypothetical protein